MRAVLWIHRYLGVATGFVMLSWCLSGFVMMYVGYPTLTEAQRVNGLSRVDWRACSDAPRALPEHPEGPFRIEMLGGRPVLREDDAAPFVLRDLCTGERLPQLSLAQASAVASAYLRHEPSLDALSSAPDQWTLSGRLAAERPLYHFVTNDDSASEVYVSSSSGRLVQATTRKQRFWNWLGAIPHWLYVCELRRHPTVWSDVVITASLLGCFLTLTGLYLTVARWPVLRRRARQAAFGTHFWHHAAGLFFGLCTLTWVGSGLLSVQPWGILQSSSIDVQRLQGRPPAPAELSAALRALWVTLASEQYVSIQFVPVDGEPFFIVSTADGRRKRLDASGRPAALGARDWSRLAQRLGSAPPSLLSEGDAYYFHHHDHAVALPAYRFSLPGPAARTLYFDATTGQFEAAFDDNARSVRWIEGLHRLDLMPALRRRPLWDLLTLLLLSGVTALCATGAVLSCRSLFVRKR